MGFHDSWWNINLVILAALFFEILCRKTDRQPNAMGTKTTHSAVVVFDFRCSGRRLPLPAPQNEWAFTHGADSARTYNWLPLTAWPPSTVLVPSVVALSAPLGGSIWRDNLQHVQSPSQHKMSMYCYRVLSRVMRTNMFLQPLFQVSQSRFIQKMNHSLTENHH